jgi:hypothetical protein
VHSQSNLSTAQTALTLGIENLYARPRWTHRQTHWQSRRHSVHCQCVLDGRNKTLKIHRPCRTRPDSVACQHRRTLCISPATCSCNHPVLTSVPAIFQSLSVRNRYRYKSVRHAESSTEPSTIQNKTHSSSHHPKREHQPSQSWAMVNLPASFSIFSPCNSSIFPFTLSMNASILPRDDHEQNSFRPCAVDVSPRAPARSQNIHVPHEENKNHTFPTCLAVLRVNEEILGLSIPRFSTVRCVANGRSVWMGAPAVMFSVCCSVCVPDVVLRS